MSSRPSPIAQLGALTGQLTGRQRHGLIVAAAGVVVVIACLGWKGLSTPEQPLFEGRVFPSHELRDAQTALRQAGISGFRIVGGKIYVPEASRAQCERLLAPESANKAAFGDAYEKALSQSAWPVSESHRQELMDSARASELIAMFRGDPNIADARLMWNRAKRRSFGPESRTTAILGITPRQGRRVSAELADSLRMSVTSAFGLTSVDDVTLIEYGPQGARVVRAATERQPESGDAAVDREPAEATAQVEEHEDIASEHRDAIAGKLSWIPNVEVSVAARPKSREHGASYRPASNSPESSDSRVVRAGHADEHPDWNVVVKIPEAVTRSLAARPEYDIARGTRSEQSMPTQQEVRRRIERVVARRLGVSGAVPFRDFVSVEFKTSASQSARSAGATAVAARIAAFTNDWSGSLGVLGGLLGLVWLVPVFARRRLAGRQAAPQPDRKATDPEELTSAFELESLFDADDDDASAISAAAFQSQSDAVTTSLVEPVAESQPAQPETGFVVLRDCSAEEWRALLTGEHPQTIALILSRLPPAQSAFVLRLLGATLRLDVVRRLSAVEPPPPAVLRELEALVEQRLRQARTSRLDELRRSTTALSPSHFTPNTTRHDESAAPLSETPPEHLPAARFDDLRLLDDGAIRDLFAEFELSLWATALKGADAGLHRKLRDGLPPQSAAELDLAVSQTGPVRLSDVDSAQHTICRNIARIRWRGRRRLPSPPSALADQAR